MKRFIPFIVLLVGLGYLLSAFRPSAHDAGYDLAGFGRLPVLPNWRVQPLDTIARRSLPQFPRHPASDVGRDF